MAANLLLTYYLLIRLKGVALNVACMHDRMHALIGEVGKGLLDYLQTHEELEGSEEPPTPFGEWDRG